ncbi:MAG: hypothetical protein MI757_01410, partial [Pirellulales bacterium]|nr:hypothetical protein [Pirellulales bacterium]
SFSDSSELKYDATTGARQIRKTTEEEKKAETAIPASRDGASTKPLRAKRPEKLAAKGAAEAPKSPTGSLVLVFRLIEDSANPPAVSADASEEPASEPPTPAESPANNAELD